jgi:cupin 2 domain-containing protein
MRIGNLFTGYPQEHPDELFERLVETPALKLERIVSHGHATPPGHWYDQDLDEWVVVLKGSAGVRFEGQEKTQVLRAGDHLRIPAHAKHRVEWTDPQQETVWLALHYAWRPTTT